MATRKSMTLPVIITLIIIGIIVYLFANIKQTEVTCVKNNLFDDNIRVNEEVTAVIDNKRIVNSNRNMKSYYFKNKFYDPNTSQKFEKSFDYSNYLLDNLKNKISGICFNNKY